MLVLSGSVGFIVTGEKYCSTVSIVQSFPMLFWPVFLPLHVVAGFACSAASLCQWPPP